MIVTIECDSPNVVIGNSPNPMKVIVELTKDGIDGKSAFEIAVENGYPGTEVEFGLLLASITKKEDKLNWWKLIVSANKKALLTNDSAGKLYKYRYHNIYLYRFIKADKTEDSFYLEEAKKTLIATRFSTINL
jgi:hypothetical protein